MSVRLKNLAFWFHDKVLFENFSYEIPAGKVTLIQGPSGCGKSTFLKLVAGLIQPTSGQIEKSNSESVIGYLHQDIHLIEHWSIAENLNLADSDKKNQKKWLEKFDLPMNPNSLVARLSGGEKQRVGLVRTVLSRPDLILLDEPTAHLDDEHTDTALKTIRKEFCSKTVIIVSHDQRVQNYSDNILNWKKEVSRGV